MTDNKSLSYLMDIDKINKEKFSQVISDIENLKTEVSNIKSKVDSSLPVDISSVNTSISDVNLSMSDVKSDTSAIKQTMDSNGLFAAGSVFKSVQRGIWTGRQIININGRFTIATISNVNPEKSVLIINAQTNNRKGMASEQQAYVLNNNSILVTNTGVYDGNQILIYMVDWQVIEFY